MSGEEKLEIKKFKELAGAYKKYDEIKVKEGYFDYGDLIVKTLQLFRQRKNVLHEYQKQFKYILVDEYQDTNFAQNELVKLLARKGNIAVVADDDQAIYRWRGAAVSNVIQFRKSFPKAKIITLSKNYRSTQEILDRAYDLIQHNNPDRLEVVEKIDKRLISEVGSPTSRKASRGDSIELIHVDRVENEAEEVAKEIGKLIANSERRIDCKDIAILVRANNHAEPFSRAFARHSIPYQFLGPGRLFRQPEIIDLISYLKVLYNFEDSVAFYRILSLDYFGISARDLAAIGNYARRKNLSLFEASEQIDNLFVSTDTKEKVKKITALIHKHLGLIRRETAGQILYYFLQDTGLIQKLINPESSDAQKRAANISKFFDKLKSYEVDHEDATIPAVVDWIELSAELGESPLAADIDWTEMNAVNLLTVHSAKGLEFPVVFLVNLVSQRFPTMEKREQIPIPDELIKEILPKGDYHLQEERRLFYVGMTRAKEKLYFTAADYYGEGKREKALSPFINEALSNASMSSDSSCAEAMADRQLSFLDYKPSADLSTSYQLPATIHIDYLSYSQIETFKTCPLHYKLKYIYKIPTPPSSSQSFGNSFHLTLKAFYEALARHEKPTEALMYKVLEKNWISEGYLGKSHEKSSFAKAKRFLKYYLDNTFNPKIVPIVMEQPFTVKISNLRVGGKIDRVDVQGDILEIIDYKTGAHPLSQKDANKDLQLSIYGLAATSIREFPFARKPDQVRLSLYYFDTPQIVTTTRTKEQLDEAIEEIFKVCDEIEKSDFVCSGNYLCKNCEFKMLCNTNL